ncbi:MAG: hypothetical protein ABIL62_16035 [Planctomycetota bacterium]
MKAILTDYPQYLRKSTGNSFLAEVLDLSAPRLRQIGLCSHAGIGQRAVLPVWFNVDGGHLLDSFKQFPDGVWL